MSNVAKHVLTTVQTDAWITHSGAQRSGGTSAETYYSISQDDLRQLVARVFQAGANVDVMGVKYKRVE